MEVNTFKGSILGLDGSGANVRCAGSSRLRRNHSYGSKSIHTLRLELPVSVLAFRM